MLMQRDPIWHNASGGAAEMETGEAAARVGSAAAASSAISARPEGTKKQLFALYMLMYCLLIVRLLLICWFLFSFCILGMGLRNNDGSAHDTANLRTKTLDFKGFDSSRIWILRGWNSHVHREFPGKLESSNLNREILSRKIGRKKQGWQCWW